MAVTVLLLLEGTETETCRYDRSVLFSSVLFDSPRNSTTRKVLSQTFGWWVHHHVMPADLNSNLVLFIKIIYSFLQLVGDPPQDKE